MLFMRVWRALLRASSAATKASNTSGLAPKNTLFFRRAGIRSLPYLSKSISAAEMLFDKYGRERIPALLKNKVFFGAKPEVFDALVAADDALKSALHTRMKSIPELAPKASHTPVRQLQLPPEVNPAELRRGRL